MAEEHVMTAEQMLMCPCCRKSSASFITFGVRPRRNALCPNCGALERHRLLALYLQENPALFNRATVRVLHMSPEPSIKRILRSLKNVSYTGSDLIPGVGDDEVDICDLPYRSGSFDAIICYHVMEHVQDDRKAMRELQRVLAPGGWAIIQSPVVWSNAETVEDHSVTDPQERERLFGQRDHVRLYGRDYVTRLEGAGFHVTLDPFVRHLDPVKVLACALASDEDICFCR